MCRDVRKKEIPGGARDFAIQGMDTRNKETWDISGTQLYIILPLYYFLSYSEKILTSVNIYIYDWPSHIKTSCIFA